MSDASEANEKHLAESIDTFMVQLKRKARKKSLKVAGVSVAIVVVIVLLKKDKANTVVYVDTLEKYEKLLLEHLKLQEKYMVLAESYLDVTEKVLNAFDEKVAS